MILQKVRLKNFLSYKDTIVELTNQGFVAVRGENRTDATNSNGAGKSGWVEAIVWCITGETIRGTKSVKNNLTKENCEVTVQLSNLQDIYIINRVKGGALTLIKNDVDISGKGIRDTQELLSSLFVIADIDFLSATTVLGQGMPLRFTNNKPAGRKEVLEKLTKTDFQIEEVKGRLVTLKSENQIGTRQVEDELLKVQTEIKLLTSQVARLKVDLENLSFSGLDEYGNSEEVLQSQVTAANEEQQIAKTALAECKLLLDKKLKEIYSAQQEDNTKYRAFSEAKQKILSEIAEQKSSLLQKVSGNRATISANKERIATGTEVECPECHTVFNTEKDMGSLLELNEQLRKDNEEITTKISGLALRETEERATSFQSNPLLIALEAEGVKLESSTSTLSNEVTSIDSKLRGLNLTLASLQAKKKQLKEQKTQLETRLATEQELLTNLQTLRVPQLQAELSTLTSTAADLNKLYSFATKEFRGVLLEDTVAQFQLVARELCEQVFNTRELNIFIEGSALEIEFKGKELDGLSGGERQGVDIVLQLALRSLLLSLQQEASSLLVCDEILDNLDTKLSTKVVELISNLGLESVFFITHHGEELQLPYDKELLIVKEKGISRVES